MPTTDTFKEDLVSIVMLIFICARDFCKRVSRSDCVYDTDNGLRVKLPTWHGSNSSSRGGHSSGTDEPNPV